MNKYEQALKCPVCVYTLPQQVLDDKSLTATKKIKILQQWEQDARLIATADGENMVGDSPSMLNRVKVALYTLKK